MRAEQEAGISIEQFVAGLMKNAEIITAENDSMVYGYRQGWLSEQDKTDREAPIVKKHCARIVHEFLRLEQKEPDELDSGPAGKLQDLFDCRVCAGHVMQVYTKGIMDGYRNEEGRYIFGMDDRVSAAMAEDITDRLFHKEKRAPRVSSQELQTDAEKIDAAEAARIRAEEKHTVLIDVRSETEYYDGHLQGAVHCPMMNILKNPYMVSERRDIHVLLYCEKGYMSETAAQSLIRVGYEKVSYFAWNE